MCSLNSLYSLHYFLNDHLHDFVEALHAAVAGENTIGAQLGSRLVPPNLARLPYARPEQVNPVMYAF